MQSALELLAEMTYEDTDWLLSQGTERQVIANTVIIEEGTQPSALFIVLEGLVGVHVSSHLSACALLGPGELFGEMSFITGNAARATVKAQENSLLLAIDHDAISTKMTENHAFSSRIFRAFAVMNIKRLRSSVDEMGRQLNDRDKHASDLDKLWPEVAKQLNDFKQLMRVADREAIENDDQVPDQTAQRIYDDFERLTRQVNQLMNQQTSDYIKNELGDRCARELIPYINMSHIGDRMYAKPRGYAGDFLTIEYMYQDEASGSGRLGPVIDRAIRSQPANKAVMNRRGLLKEQIQHTLDRSFEGTVHVTSLASGPAAELFDVFESAPNANRLKATCIDIDMQALAFVADKRDKLKLTPKINLVNGNLVYLATGRQKLDLPPQELIYSIGLIDYFSDKFVVLLLNYIYDRLKPGGRVILGNFHPDNPTKALMDHLLDWKLIHRNEADMHRLYKQSKFDRMCTRIMFEEERVNLFAECIK